MANPVGRPKEYDRLKIGDDFIKWAKENPDCLTVPHFATSIGLNSQILINWCSEDPQFHLKYIEAKEIIGLNRLNASRLVDETEKKRLDKSIYLQTLWQFDFDSRNSKREELIFEKSLENQSQKLEGHFTIEHINATSDNS